MIPKIVKDTSTFFYLNYTGTRSRQPYSAVETVPTAQERMGDFSQIATDVRAGADLLPGDHYAFPEQYRFRRIMLNPIAQQAARLHSAAESAGPGE